MYHEQKNGLINQESIALNAAELSTLMPVLCTRKINFRCHFNIRQCLLLKIVTSN